MQKLATVAGDHAKVTRVRRVACSLRWPLPLMFSSHTQTTEEREQRLDRWHKLEHDVLVLSAYVLRKRFSACVELARLIDDPLALHEGEQGEPAWGTGVEDGVRKHAVFLWGLQQRINAVRVQLGLQALVYPPRDR